VPTSDLVDDGPKPPVRSIELPPPNPSRPTLARRGRPKQACSSRPCPPLIRWTVGPKPPVRSIESPHECVADICIDEYLWSLYERTTKIDTD